MNPNICVFNVNHPNLKQIFATNMSYRINDNFILGKFTETDH